MMITLRGEALSEWIIPSWNGTSKVEVEIIR
jgi:hypothetical protein